MDENKEGGKLKKVGNWVSAILLGDTRELIAHIDERTIMMQRVLEDIKPKGATNTYDAEQVVLLVIKELPVHCPDVVDRLKNGAFNAGVNIDTVRWYLLA